MVSGITRRMILAAVALPLVPAGARAAYPDRVITLIVPFAAGGPTDIIARIVSVAFQKSLGQSVVVENRGGGGGNPGMAIAARATPDGYTLLLTSTAIAVNQALYKSLPYDPIKDFIPICELVNAPNVLFVRTESDIKSVADLARSTIRAPAPAPSRTSPPSSSSCAPASTWCTFPIAAAAPPPWRCSSAPWMSARWRSRRSSR
jgi:tripartite-type tricarboxylate transporter receptor subunit TctC